MPKFTPEQTEAIHHENENILVSAGAGSGKTAVLTERIIRKIKDGCNINELLVLTFTKAAAHEMKERVRHKLIEHKMEDQLKLIDSSYITTFDAFALSILRKYHYKLNIPKDITITDSSMIELKKQEILQDIFNQYYDKQEAFFLELIKKYCLKDDKNIFDNILNIYKKIELKPDTTKFISEYAINYLKEENITHAYLEFEKLCLNMLDKANDSYEQLLAHTYELENFNYDLSEQIMPLLKAKSIDEIIKTIHYKHPRLANASEEAKEFNQKIKDIINAIKELLPYNTKQEYLDSIRKTFFDQEAFIQILTMFNEQLQNYKKEYNAYDFSDIAKMSLRILNQYDDVRLEIKNNLKEILIDEYQDTSDIQEQFVNLIGENNIYMVGDIKQSIYRFRNANPTLFKDKYIKYGNHIGGKKIDLAKNFRSRKEVLDDINHIFSNIMSLEFGGADYKQGHEMIFGNTSFDHEGVIDFNTNLEVLSYVIDPDGEWIEFKKEELEAFIIASNIKNKIESNYKVFDHALNQIRSARYEDFAILIERKTNFVLYKKIFDYFNIPLQVFEDEVLTNSSFIKLLNNILILIVKCYAYHFDKEFFYALMSVSRSYLFEISDGELYHLKDNFKTNKAFLIALELSKYYDKVGPNVLLRRCIKAFEIIEKAYKIGNVHDVIVRLEYFDKLLNEFSLKLNDLNEFIQYINNVYENELKISYANINQNLDAVSLMSIHRSKGLEFKIIYQAGLDSRFNLSDATDFICFHDELGIIFPDITDNDVRNTFYKSLYKNKYKKDEISEKIRLFYVALTRAKEKIILLNKIELKKGIEVKTEKDIDEVNTLQEVLSNFKDLEDYCIKVDLEQLPLSKGYNEITDFNYEKFLTRNDIKIMYNKHDVKFNVISKENISKKSMELISSVNINFGIKIHEYLEYINFTKPNLSHIDDSFIKYKIERFIKSDLLKDINQADVYQEHEFYYQEQELSYHGIIDLLLVFKDKILIIDYKLKKLDDQAYEKQLLVYANYAKNFNDNVFCYLYSILEESYKEIKFF